MELFDVLDERGVPTGEVITRVEAHRTGARHRTAHVWVIRQGESGAEVLLQKRSDNKDCYPGYYDISSAGHVLAGESFMDCALRELREELGVKAAADELIFAGDYAASFNEVFYGEPFIDDQVAKVYILNRASGAYEFKLQAEEISAVLWAPLKGLIHRIESGELKSCIAADELILLENKLKEIL